MPLLKKTYGLLIIGMLISLALGVVQYLDGMLPFMIIVAVGFGLSAIAARVADEIIVLLTDIRRAVSEGEQPHS